jgi:hypothetical protein
MSQTTAFENYKSCRDKLATCKLGALAAARAAFLAGCQEIFKANSELRSFGWHARGDGSLSTRVPDINELDGIDLESEGDDHYRERQLQELAAEFLGWFNEADLRALLKEEKEVITERDSLSRRYENAWEVLRIFHEYFRAQTELARALAWHRRATKAAFMEGCRRLFAKDRDLSFLTWYIPDEDEEADDFLGVGETKLWQHPCAVNIPFEDFDYYDEYSSGGSDYDLGELGDMLVCDLRDVFGDGKLTARRKESGNTD